MCTFSETKPRVEGGIRKRKGKKGKPRWYQRYSLWISFAGGNNLGYRLVLIIHFPFPLGPQGHVSRSFPYFFFKYTFLCLLLLPRSEMVMSGWSNCSGDNAGLGDGLGAIQTLSCLWSCPPRGNFKRVGVMALQKFPADGDACLGWLAGREFIRNFCVCSCLSDYIFIDPVCPWPRGNMWK